MSSETLSNECIFIMASQELRIARVKFPSNEKMLHAFTEEAGEVTKAFLDNEQGKCDEKEIVKECIQTIAMAMRLLQEGDPQFKFDPKNHAKSKRCDYVGCSAPYRQSGPCALCYE